MADHAPTTRRSMLAATLALSTTAAAGAGAVLGAHRALAADPHPDAALLALEPEMTALIAFTNARVSEEQAVEVEVFALAKSRVSGGVADPRWLDALDAARNERGLPALEEATKAAHRACTRAEDRIDPMRATTLDGLRMKARLAVRWEDLLYSIREDLLALDGVASA